MKAVIALVLMAVTAQAQNTLESSRAELFSATNHWGRDQQEFHQQVNDSARWLMTVRTHGSYGVMRDWLETVLELPVPTNTVQQYQTWLREKTETLSRGYLRAVLTPDCTNFWMRYAGCYSQLQSKRRPMNQVLVEAREKYGDDLAGWRKWVWEQNDRASADESAMGRLFNGMICDIGRFGIPELPENERWPFFTNLVERAGLSEDRCQQLRKSVEEGCAAKKRSQRVKKRQWMNLGDVL